MSGAHLSFAAKHVILCAFFIVFNVQPASAQNELRPTVWLKSTNLIAPSLGAPASVGLVPVSPSQVTNQPRDFIGNYPVFPDSSQSLLSGLEKITDSYTGSLFVVFKTNAQPSNLPLIVIGPTRIYLDSTNVRDQSFGNIQIDSLSSLVRVQYQGSSLMKSWKRFVRVDSAVSIAEVIFYDRYLSPLEARKVESYLALKYSINISRNRDKSLRDYLATDKSKYWNYNSDKEYSKTIMGIGRVDEFDFFQLNTFSSDSRSIQFAVYDSLGLGESVRDSLSNNSLVVLSEKKLSTLKSSCNQLVGERYWKLRFIDWSLPNPQLYLLLDTNYQTHSQFYAYDGYSNYLVSATPRGGLNVIPIPVPHNLSNGVMYLMSTEIDSSCLPDLDFAFVDCGDSTASTGTLHLKVPEDQLPVNLSLHNEKDGHEFSFVVDDPLFQVVNINRGVYRVILENRSGLLIDKVFALNSCQPPSQTGTASVPSINSTGSINLFYTSKNQFGSATASNGTQNQIEVFPNPSLDLTCRLTAIMVDLEQLEISIIDAQGKVLEKKELQLETSNTIELHFPRSGVYTVRCTADGFYHATQVIIY